MILQAFCFLSFISINMEHYKIILLLNFYVDWCSAYMYVCTPLVLGVYKGQKKALDALELES